MKKLKLELPSPIVKVATPEYKVVLNQYVKNDNRLVFAFAACLSSVHTAISIIKTAMPEANLLELKEDIKSIALTIAFEINETFALIIDMIKLEIEKIVDRMFPTISLDIEYYKTYESIYGLDALDDEPVRNAINERPYEFSELYKSLKKLYSYDVTGIRVDDSGSILGA